jgi:hypothetical protein
MSAAVVMQVMTGVGIIVAIVSGVIVIVSRMP